MIETIGIIGAGTMGNGIAQVCAAAGLKVTMIDIADAAVARGMATITGSLERLVNKQKMTDAVTEAIQDWVAKERASQPIPERPARTSLPTQGSGHSGA